MTPFCPWREANLSPGTGLRLMRSLIETFSQRASEPSEPSMRTSSTKAASDILWRLSEWRPVDSSTYAHSGSPCLTSAPIGGKPSAPSFFSNSRSSSVGASVASAPGGGDGGPTVSRKLPKR